MLHSPWRLQPKRLALAVEEGEEVGIPAARMTGTGAGRNLKTTLGITVFPILIYVLLVVLQNVINGELDKAKVPVFQVGCFLPFLPRSLNVTDYLNALSRIVAVR
ncbi:hypothetical protein ABZP36_005633 [Zizania latifolia]